jgi:hypothetical protein
MSGFTLWVSTVVVDLYNYFISQGGILSPCFRTTR